jgi:hypothetical protein
MTIHMSGTEVRKRYEMQYFYEITSLICIIHAEDKRHASTGSSVK